MKKSHFTNKDICLGRVLSEDEDFILIEVGKRDDVVYHLQQNNDGETVGGDRFYTLIFTGGKPWEEND